MKNKSYFTVAQTWTKPPHIQYGGIIFNFLTGNQTKPLCLFLPKNAFKFKYPQFAIPSPQLRHTFYQSSTSMKNSGCWDSIEVIGVEAPRSPVYTAALIVLVENGCVNFVSNVPPAETSTQEKNTTKRKISLATLLATKVVSKVIERTI